MLVMTPLFPDRATISLVGLNLVLIAVIAIELLVESAFVPSASATPPASLELIPAEPEPPKFHPPPREHFAAIVERPLFEPSRRPYVSSKSHPSPAPEVEEVAVELIGTFLSKEQRLALVRLGTQGQTKSVREGEFLSNWRIQRVLADHLLLRRNDETRVIGLWPDLSRESP